MKNLKNLNHIGGHSGKREHEALYLKSLPTWMLAMEKNQIKSMMKRLVKISNPLIIAKQKLAKKVLMFLLEIP